MPYKTAVFADLQTDPGKNHLVSLKKNLLSNGKVFLHIRCEITMENIKTSFLQLGDKMEGYLYGEAGKTTMAAAIDIPTL